MKWEAIGGLSKAVTRCDLGFKSITLAAMLRINRRREVGNLL